MQTIHVIVEGLVQGVSFREYTRRQAYTLGLTGWVRNLPNGSVEAILSGPAAQIDTMIEWLGRGSPRSRVDDVQISESAGGEQFTSFEIRF